MLGLKQSEVNLSHAVWVLPPSRLEDKKRRTKNRDEHRIPLSPLAVKLIDEAMRLAPDSEWLFANRAGNGPLEAHAASTAMRRS